MVKPVKVWGVAREHLELQVEDERRRQISGLSGGAAPATDLPTERFDLALYACAQMTTRVLREPLVEWQDCRLISTPAGAELQADALASF